MEAVGCYAVSALTRRGGGFWSVKELGGLCYISWFGILMGKLWVGISTWLVLLVDFRMRW